MAIPGEGVRCRPGGGGGDGRRGRRPPRPHLVPSPKRWGPLPGSDTLREPEGDTERSRGGPGARAGVWPRTLSSGLHVVCSPLSSPALRTPEGPPSKRSLRRCSDHHRPQPQDEGPSDTAPGRPGAQQGSHGNAPGLWATTHRRRHRQTGAPGRRFQKGLRTFSLGNWTRLALA